MTNVALRELLNTLYVLAQGAYVHVDHETLKIELEGKTQLQVPIHHLGAVVCFGNVMVSPALIHQCAQDGRSLVFMDRNGRFRARMVGPTSGNVLLRQAQYRAASDSAAALDIARSIVGAKIKNSRQVLMRGARQRSEGTPAAGALREAAGDMATILPRVKRTTDLDHARGLEGEAAVAYFSALPHLILVDSQSFAFAGRSRRPPRDPVNALLSFIYALVRNDCVSAAEGVGLDPQVGYLHAVRPGRPALALDLMEELRSVLADRLTLTLINRRQVTEAHFEHRPGGAVSLTEEGRKTVVVAYQKRKAEEVHHPLLDRDLPLGLVPHVQVRLLARHLRGDMEHYLPYVHQ